MSNNSFLFYSSLGKLTAVIVLLFATIQSMAWDTLPDENGKYDEFYFSLFLIFCLSKMVCLFSIL